MQLTQNDTKKFGTILGIWAHPDDEVFSSAGLMRLAVENGQKILLVTATRGDAGQTADTRAWQQDKLAEIRTSELEKSLQLLGVTRRTWLDYPDGGLVNTKTDEALQRIREFVGKDLVDTIVTFEPNGITGHNDHKTVFRWANKLASERGVPVLCSIENKEFYESYGKKLDAKYNIYFNIEKPYVVPCEEVDVCLKLNKKMQQLKLEALSAHESQTSGILKSMEGRRMLEKLCQRECFMYAENIPKIW